jgi:hypothetical protein
VLGFVTLVLARRIGQASDVAKTENVGIEWIGSQIIRKVGRHSGSWREPEPAISAGEEEIEISRLGLDHFVWM